MALSGGNTYISIRFVYEALGAKVNWNQNSSAVSMGTNTKNRFF